MSTVMAILIYFILDINWSVPSGDIYHVCGFRIYTPVLTSVASNKKCKSSIIPLSPTELKNGCKLGTDSHAEVTCYGRHARITHIHEGMTSNVAPFHDSYAPLENVNFANARYAHDSEDGQTYILHHRYGLDFTHNMEDSILCSNQTRAHGVIVDDVPKIFDHRGTSTHSIIFSDDDVELPLSLHNSISYLPVRYPTDEDMNDGIDLFLSDDFPWDPTLFCNNHTLRSDIDAEKLADLWHISITNAARTLKCVDMDRLREVKGQIHKRYISVDIINLADIYLILLQIPSRAMLHLYEVTSMQNYSVIGPTSVHPIH